MGYVAGPLLVTMCLILYNDAGFSNAGSRSTGTMQTFARWVTTPENRVAQLAVERVAECLCVGRARRLANPLYLVGPAGIGKSHLASALAGRIARQSLNLVVTFLEARDL